MSGPGSSRAPKRLSCRWFYDAAGARLFEEICELPEYYLTRVEEEILTTHRAEITSSAPPGAPWSSSAAETRGRPAS